MVLLSGHNNDRGIYNKSLILMSKIFIMWGIDSATEGPSLKLLLLLVEYCTIVSYYQCCLW